MSATALARINSKAYAPGNKFTPRKRQDKAGAELGLKPGHENFLSVSQIVLFRLKAKTPGGRSAFICRRVRKLGGIAFVSWRRT